MTMFNVKVISAQLAEDMGILVGESVIARKIDNEDNYLSESGRSYDLVLTHPDEPHEDWYCFLEEVETGQ